MLKVDAAGVISGCPALGATNTIVTPTTITGVETVETPVDTTFPPGTGSGLVTGSQAQFGQVCTTEVPETPIPTMSAMGVALFVALLGLSALLVLGRRRISPAKPH